jgi:hypothetical protein
MGVRMHRHGMAQDAAARLLDHQTALQLSSAQVNQLIALHEATRSQERPVLDRLRGLDHKSQRDSAGALIDQLRLMRWREESSADSLLTDDQRRTAARLEEGPRMSGMTGGMTGGMMRPPGRPDQSAR